MEALCDCMECWRELISPAPVPTSRHNKFWRFTVAYPVPSSPYLSIGFTILMLGGVFHGKSLLEASRGLKMGFTFITVNYTLAVWPRWRREVNDILLQLKDLAVGLEPYAEKHEVELTNTGRLIISICEWAKVYTVMLVLTLLVPLLVSQDALELPLWPWPEGKLWVVLGGLMQVTLGMSFAYPCIINVSGYVCFNMIQVSMQDVLAEAFRGAKTASDVKKAAILDVRLLDTGCRLRETMAGFNACIVIMLITPLISTVQAAHGQYDLFGIVSSGFVVMFVMLCHGGQTMRDACLRVGDSLYEGRWLEIADPDSLSTIKMAMLRRSKPPGVTAGMGIGNLDLHGCKETLKSWYSLLQILLKF